MTKEKKPKKVVNKKKIKGKKPKREKIQFGERNKYYEKLFKTIAIVLVILMNFFYVLLCVTIGGLNGLAIGVISIIIIDLVVVFVVVSMMMLSIWFWSLIIKIGVREGIKGSVESIANALSEKNVITDIPVEPKYSAYDQNKDYTNLKKIVKEYEVAISESNYSNLSNFYTKNAMIMNEKEPTIVGRENIVNYYQTVFKKYRLNMKFEIKDFEIYHNNGYVVMHSISQIISKKTGMPTVKHNRELLIVKRDANGWKISKYIFNGAPTNEELFV
ncbi:MAG: DUF4440 domain-containing protein [Mycoplasmataceae bacterium]|nr:DUF4440 domain-containing protein [Mycoplasmataceae bacterium]